MNLEFKINNVSIELLTDFIYKNNYLFVPELSSQVDLPKYIEKIYKYAIIFEAHYDNKLIGIIAAYNNHETKSAFLTLVLCDKEYLHKGVISKLYMFAENNLKKQNLKKFELETQENNIISQKLYKKLGFTAIKNYSSKIQYEKTISENNKVISIICFTYNQFRYIKQCLDGFLMQKGNFDIEILVHDDCSTDGTKEILEEYANKYSNIIKPFYEKENQYQKSNFIRILKNIYGQCKGKYIAICEGDDYWCDEYKLQKQVDFMESHPDYALCYHPAKMIYEDESHKPIIIGESKHKNPQPYYNLLKGNYIPANSVMYRTKYLKQELLDYPECIYPGDWYNHIVVSSHGKIGYLPDVMYVYRWHSQGISHTTSDNPVEEIHLKYGVKEVNFYFAVWNKIKKQFPQYYKELFIPTLRNVYYTYLKHNKFDELNILQQNYTEYFKDIEINTGINKYRKKYKKYKKLFKIFLLISIILFCISLILLLIFTL